MKVQTETAMEITAMEIVHPVAILIHQMEQIFLPERTMH